MASLNKVMLIGNAGKDAELRYTANGTAQSQFSLAVNFRRKGASGEWEEATEWFNIVVFGDQAERISQYVTKGKQVYVEGRLQTRTWDDDQGQKHYRTEVIANQVLFLGSRENQGGGEWSGGGGQARSSFAGTRRGGGDVEPDDLPFE
ncbi:MAG: single-stranded DNA-binding protein [Thermoflexaceae bacterium]|nr:single-stranded DNA-binding protein [Thermoflexaceae bacterium]